MAAVSRSYLDHNATSPLRPEAAEAMARALALPGNPSSVHAEGRAARAIVEEARDAVAALVGASPKNVIFTSGGTEAVNLALSPTLRRSGGAEAGFLLLGSVEHPCAIDGHRFPSEFVGRVRVDAAGRLDLAHLEERLHSVEAPALLALQVANNETGVIQPVADAAAMVEAHEGLLVADAAQAIGRVPVDLAALGADAIVLSAHKFGGPKGAGALILASSALEIGDRLIRGGGQERGHRAGTENVAAIAGLGAAAAVAGATLEAERVRLSALRDRAEAALSAIAPDAVIFSKDAERLPNTLAFAIPGLKAETALIAFDLGGVALSSGSACSSGKVRHSHVLAAMGVAPSLAEGALRVSFGWNSTESDVIRFAKTCEEVVGRLYQRRASAA